VLDSCLAKGYDLSIKEGRQKVLFFLADWLARGDHSDGEVRVWRKERRREGGIPQTAAGD
jgi:hypothetical protein